FSMNGVAKIGKYFNLQYSPKYYGPYSGKVRYVLNYLSGSYLMGYSDLNKKPFEPLLLVTDGYYSVKDYVESNPELYKIAKETINFLDGFYSDFALELLSTIDWIMKEKNTDDINMIKKELNSWSNRKRTIFSDDRYIEIAVKHLKENG
ncbi:MAG TPA: Appr-1-p processing protein, partial [Bacteroidales bacterium]|nr:Appr-1-p processing protein [Bacteroidales bacterium]